MRNEIPKFRRLEDVQRFLDEMYADLDVSGQLVKHQQELLSKLTSPTPKLKAMLQAAVEFDVTPSPSKSSELRKLQKKIDPALSKVVIPNLAKLKDQYGLLEDLYGKHTTLDSVSTQIAMQFPDRRGPAFDKAIGSINELKAKVEAQLRTVFEFLSKVAQKHVPEAFMAYTQAIQEKISEHVFFEDSQRFLYVSVREGGLTGEFTVVSGKPTALAQNIVFTEYMLLTDSVSDEGKIAPQLYVVVQWTVGGAVEVFVEHEFTPPNQLSSGDEVSTVQEATGAIARMLELEGFASYLGTIPMSLQLRVSPEQLKPSMFSARNYIDKIIVDATKISFTFKHHKTTEATKKQVAIQIFPEIKAMLKTKKAKLRVKITPTSVDFYIANVAEGGQVSTHDTEFFKERFGLTDQAVSKISQIINSK